MNLDPDMQEQAYQLFVQEAQELLQQIEDDLLELTDDPSLPKIHNLVRAAHTIKGGAACVNLTGIQTLAYRLENVFRSLKQENLEIDLELAELLFQAYKCLRLTLLAQIQTGQSDADSAKAKAEPVFSQLEARLGHSSNAEAELPTAADLGVDVTGLILNTEVTQALEYLEKVLNNPKVDQLSEELKSQVEVFLGLGEFLEISEFVAIAQTTLAALQASPQAAQIIGQLALAGFRAAQEALLKGDLTAEVPVEQLPETEPGIEEKVVPPIPSLEDVFGDFVPSPELVVSTQTTPNPVTPIPALSRELPPDLVKDTDAQVTVPEAVKLVEQTSDSSSHLDELQNSRLEGGRQEAEERRKKTIQNPAAEAGRGGVATALTQSKSFSQNPSSVLHLTENCYGSLPPLSEFPTSTARVNGVAKSRDDRDKRTNRQGRQGRQEDKKDKGTQRKANSQNHSESRQHQVERKEVARANLPSASELTLKTAQLFVWQADSAIFALPYDKIKEHLIPKASQIVHSKKQRFLHWQEQEIPVYQLSELLSYNCPLPETTQSKSLGAASSVESRAGLMLVISQGQQILAIESAVERLVPEPELAIKLFGTAIAPPNYLYGCTILSDERLVPVIDVAALLSQTIDQIQTASAAATLLESHRSAIADKAALSQIPPSMTANKGPTVLVVDDSNTLRQLLTLTLQKAGYQVLQAEDGLKAIAQLQQNSMVQLALCDVEMPNLNGFGFLSHCRRDPQLAKVPVVMLSSCTSEQHRQLAMHLGATAYLTKPYKEPELLAALKTIISNHAGGSRCPR